MTWQDKNKYPEPISNRLNHLLEKDNTHTNDKERIAMFYILAGNIDLYNKVEHIYDFNHHQINPDCLESQEVDFSSSSRKLIKLAYNLYNGYPADVLDTFCILDKENFKIALTAIQIRFNITR